MADDGHPDDGYLDDESLDAGRPGSRHVEQERPADGFDLFLELPPGPGRALAVERALRAAIREGRLAEGVRLPSSRALAAELGLARGTVAQAYSQLVAEGWLDASPGRAGTQVARGLRSAAVQAPPARPAPRHDLMPGRPDVSAFPRRAWLRAIGRALPSMPADAFGYGDPRGRPELRTALADYLGRVRGVRADPGHLVICGGYTQGLSLLAQVFAGLGATRAGMEDPGLPHHVEVVRAYLSVADIPVDEDGLDVRALRESGAQVAVCTPAHQFPLGVSLSPRRRQALIDWARSAGGWIVEDDYDGEFGYGGRQPGALQAACPERVVYAGSVSKSLGPGLRLGWIVCPPALADALAEAKRRADRVTSPIDQLALAGLLRAGDYDRHLRRMRQTYRRRRDALAALLADQLPAIRPAGTEAGLHALLELGPDPAGRPPSSGCARRCARPRSRCHCSATTRAPVSPGRARAWWWATAPRPGTPSLRRSKRWPARWVRSTRADRRPGGQFVPAVSAVVRSISRAASSPAWNRESALSRCIRFATWRR